MKIGILTSLVEHCGLTVFAHEMQRALQPHGECSILPYWERIPEGLDAVIVNFHPARTGIHLANWDAARAAGTKLILIHHNSVGFGPPPEYISDLVPHVDVVVTHEPTEYGTHFIPHGIVDVDDLPPINSEPTIGTAGFAFPWKRFDVVVEAARRSGAIANLVCPPYHGIDQEGLRREWQRQLGDRLLMECRFLPQREVVQQLSRSWVNIFWFDSQGAADCLGQTGSARMGVAAKRPMIISRHRKFETFKPYADEFYIAESPEHIHQLVEQIIRDIRNGLPVKIPNRILRDQGWSRVGELFAMLVDSLRNKADNLGGVDVHPG